MPAASRRLILDTSTEAFAGQANVASIFLKQGQPFVAGDRQVQGAKVGITANQGLFGHGSSVIVKK